MYNNMYTSEVKSLWVNACNILVVVNILRYIQKNDP